MSYYLRGVLYAIFGPTHIELNPQELDHVFRFSRQRVREASVPKCVTSLNRTRWRIGNELEPKNRDQTR